ncbi:hypothetical protein AAY473_020629 [Plecturocebus cupreus]
MEPVIPGPQSRRGPQSSVSTGLFLSSVTNMESHCGPGRSAVVQTQLTAASTAGVQAILPSSGDHRRLANLNIFFCSDKVSSCGPGWPQTPGLKRSFHFGLPKCWDSRLEPPESKYFRLVEGTVSFLSQPA